MSTFDDPGPFGRQWAATYDTAGNPDPAAAVDFLAGLAAGGPVLELAIGTGRVALPLAARGLRVHGVEGSAEMVAKLRAKPGGADLPVVVGDMADADVRGPFPLAYLICNTLFNLVDAQRQADCFRTIARVLAPGGAFVIEAFVPDLADFERDEQHPQVHAVTEDGAEFRLHRYDRAAQTFVRRRVDVSTEGLRLQPFGMRYLWPEQIDRLAAQAGLRLAARYADWHRQPFTGASTDHVSVYRAP